MNYYYNVKYTTYMVYFSIIMVVYFSITIYMITIKAMAFIIFLLLRNLFFLDITINIIITIIANIDKKVHLEYK